MTSEDLSKLRRFSCAALAAPILISSHMVSELRKVAEDVVVLKRSRLLAHERRQLHLQSLTGHASDVESASSPTTRTSPREPQARPHARGRRRTCALAPVRRKPAGSPLLTSSPCSFQDAFATSSGERLMSTVTTVPHPQRLAASAWSVSPACSRTPHLKAGTNLLCTQRTLRHRLRCKQ